MSKAEEPNVAGLKNEAEAEGKSKKGKRDSGKKGVAEAAAQLAATEEKLAEALARTAEVNEQLLRTAAEYENHRKRSQRETESAFNSGVAFSAEALLPVMDILGAAAQAPTSDEEYKKGVLMTLQKCLDIFHKLGIHEIEAMGKEFDPQLHNAVMQKEADGVESGIITEVMQSGYMLGEKVIRHAMVAVAP